MAASIYKLKEHTARLFKSAEILGMKIPFTQDEINAACIDAAEVQNIKDGYIRPGRLPRQRDDGGVGAEHQHPCRHRLLALAVLFQPGGKAQRHPAGHFAHGAGPSPDTAPVHAKAAGLYMICTLSKHAAEAKGYADAMMLDYRGYVAEATGANIFFVKDGVLHTPIPDCFLNGITRQSVIAIAKARGVKVVERHIKPEEMTDFSECFLTGSAAEVTPVSEIGPYRFKPGRLTETLDERYAGRSARRGQRFPAARLSFRTHPDNQHRARQQQDDAGGFAQRGLLLEDKARSRLARTALRPAPGCARWRRWPAQRPGTRIPMPPRRQSPPAGDGRHSARMALSVPRLNSSSQASSNTVCRSGPPPARRSRPAQSRPDAAPGWRRDSRWPRAANSAAEDRPSSAGFMPPVSASGLTEISATPAIATTIASAMARRQRIAQEHQPHQRHQHRLGLQIGDGDDEGAPLHGQQHQGGAADLGHRAQHGPEREGAD